MMMGMEKFTNSIKISPNGLKVIEAVTPEGVIVTNLIYDANAVTYPMARLPKDWL
ncbi:hypothetical protein [Alkaliphilus crotonatoxidans]